MDISLAYMIIFMYLCTTKGVQSVPLFICSGWEESRDSLQPLVNNQFLGGIVSFYKSFFMKDRENGVYIGFSDSKYSSKFRCPCTNSAIVSFRHIKYKTIAYKLRTLETCSFWKVYVTMLKQSQRTGNHIFSNYALFSQGFKNNTHILRGYLSMIGDIFSSQVLHKDVFTHPLLPKLLNLKSQEFHTKSSIDIIKLPSHNAPVKQEGIDKRLTIGDFFPLIKEKSIIYHSKFVYLFTAKIQKIIELCKKIGIKMEERFLTRDRIFFDDDGIMFDTS